jgi:endonuclease/exonuclease/phosphatase family metal-dependent hydrolase
MITHPQIPTAASRMARWLPSALAAVVLLALCGAGAAGIVAVFPFGPGPVGGALAALLLAALVLGPRPAGGAFLGRWLGVARKLSAALLACWLGLVAWSRLSPGGPAPAPKADPAQVRVVTWNIHCGQDGGPPWVGFDWSRRKHALEEALREAGPDILCVQEARAPQVAFLEQALPGYQRAGVGRDDGREGGEFSAIFFDRDRFELLAGDTFWLAGSAGNPPPGGGRICTWVRLRDRAGGTLRVYNTHSYLTEKARRPAARRIAAHVAAGDPADAVVLCGDFNAPPGAPSRRLFAGVGLADAAAGGSPTYHFGGIPLRCLDGLYVSRSCAVREHLVVDVKPGDTYPSDHFGLLADLTLGR